MKPLPTLASVLTTAVVIAAGGCGDDQMGPSTPFEEIVVPLAATAEQRELMRVALLFVGKHSMLAFQRHQATDRVAAVFVRLIQRVERNDRVGVEREIAAARDAIRQYREVARAAASAAPELEAMDFTLDRVAALTSNAPTPGTTLNSDEEHPR